MSEPSERPTFGAVYRRQRAIDKASQGPASKVIAALFLLLIGVGLGLRGMAGTVFAVVCGALAVVCAIAFCALLWRGRRSRS